MLYTVMKAILFTMTQSEMKALIFSIIALSLIRPKKSSTALPVITLYILLSLSFFAVFAVSFVCFVIIHVCIKVCTGYVKIFSLVCPVFIIK